MIIENDNIDEVGNMNHNLIKVEINIVLIMFNNIFIEWIEIIYREYIF